MGHHEKEEATVQLAEHPTVKRFYEKGSVLPERGAPLKLDAGWLRKLCLEAGAGELLADRKKPARELGRNGLHGPVD